MNTTPLHSHLDPAVQLLRRRYLWRTLAKCWAAAALLAAAHLAISYSTGRSLPGFIPVAAAAALLTAGFVRRRAQRLPLQPQDAAREIESRYPKLQALLLTASEQTPSPQTGELTFLQQRVIQEALDHPQRTLWNRHLLEQLFYAKCLHWVALTCFAAALLIELSLHAKGAMPVAAQVDITPGHVQIERGSSLPITARFSGKLPAEVHLVLLAPNGNTQHLAVARSLADPLFGATIPDVKTDLRYRVEYDGNKSRTYQIRVFDFPALESADAHLKFPAYTKLPEKTIPDTRRVAAVEGAKLDLVFHLNKPVSRATLVAKGETPIALQAKPGASNIFLASWDLQQSIHYDLRLVDSEGRTNRVPAEFEVDAIPNRPPQFKLLAPHSEDRVSPLEEMHVRAEISDDFGLGQYGLAFSLGGKTATVLPLGTNSQPNEVRTLDYLLALEEKLVQPSDLITYYLWADDIGPDGKSRRTFSDIYFAEVRPFEEIFRQNQSPSSSSSAASGQQQDPGTQLAELQKQIMNATWNLQRRETKTPPSSRFSKDVDSIQQSQSIAQERLDKLAEQVENPTSKSHIKTARAAMEAAVQELARAATDKSPKPLPAAFSQEQAAFEALLKMSSREYQVAQQRNSSGSSSSSANSRAQRQLDQLELKPGDDKYETERQALPPQTAAQREQLEVLNRLKELAQRQQDLNERLQELQTALSEARTPEERDDIERQLKRLREEQRDILRNFDDVQQRVAKSDSQQRARTEQQLDKTRSNLNQASKALDQQTVSSALASGRRAEEQLQQLKEDYRKNASNQFSDQMRQLRTEARQLAQKQEQLAQQSPQNQTPSRKQLSDSEDKSGLADQLLQQRASLDHLLTDMRKVVEQAETPEPLLSKELYDIVRKTQQTKLDAAFQSAAELLKRGDKSQALPFQQRADQGVQEIKQGVEHAAESVLGNELESLRYAKNELDQLSQQLAQGDPNSPSSNPEQAAPSTQPGQSSQSQTSSPGSPSRSPNPSAPSNPSSNPSQSSDSQRPRGSQTSPARSATDSAQSNPSQPNPESSQPGQAGQRGQRGQAGQNPASPQSNNPGQNSAQSGGAPNSGQPSPPGNSPSPGNRGPRQNRSLAASGANSGGGGSATDGGDDRRNPTDNPFTSQRPGAWFDRLGNVEEVLDDPDLRSRVAQVREQAWSIRKEARQQSQPPPLNLVRTKVIDPMQALRNDLAEEIVRRQKTDTPVPLDRDPVPVRFSNLVRSYYEQLGSAPEK